jgi:hypothetical protein
MKRIIAGLAVAALAFAAACSESQVTAVDDAALAQAASARTIWYTGNGFDYDGTTYNLNDERCGLTGQNDADDGGTGQFLGWNGPGEPYQAGQGYLLWIVTSNTGTAKLLLPGGPPGGVDMIRVGGTLKYASPYFNYADLVPEKVSAVLTAGHRNANLVVSHGCAPFEGDGAWCSPGYWKNARDAAWTLTGYAKTDLFNEVVVPNFYDTASAADPTLIQVLTTPGANTFGAASDPFGLNAFNATGAALTDAIPGFNFDPGRIGQENACPIDNHGRFK